MTRHTATRAADTVSPAIVATASAVPEQIRMNDDPVFDWLHEHQPAGTDLFAGYQQRRVLGPGETVTEIMLQAGRQALLNAQLEPRQIDMLLGYGSVGQYVTPNALAQVHAELGLPASTEVLPLNNDMTNWSSSVVLADALIRCGRIETALVICGSNWTQYVNYETPQAISAGDGAGATVVAGSSAPSQWQLVDRRHLTASQYYGDMFMAPDPAASGEYGPVYMHLTPAGLKDYVSFGGQEAIVPVQALLESHRLATSAVTMICHQASVTLLNAWQALLPDLTILNSIADYANLTCATLPLNLDRLGSQITTEYLITLGLGVQLHAGALLFSR